MFDFLCLYGCFGFLLLWSLLDNVIDGCVWTLLSQFIFIFFLKKNLVFGLWVWMDFLITIIFFKISFRVVLVSVHVVLCCCLARF